MTNFIKALSFKDLVLLLMLILVIVINTSDLIDDIREGDALLHITLEVITVSLSIGGSYLLMRLIHQRLHLHKQVQQAENNLSASQKKLGEIRREYSQHIRNTFEEWGFTKSEKDVALLILKGLSFKEIAEARNTKEKTVRQQASNIYSKSKVSSRHELSAWFFEDFLC